jgi:hypothetical protein
MSMHRSSSRLRWIAVVGLITAAGFASSVSACGSDDETPPPAGDGGGDGANDSGGPNGNDGALIIDAGRDARCDNVQPDADIDCTGKCGPVKDPCTGVVKQCGGCNNAVTADGGDGGPQTCDLTTNQCGAPKTTCAELGAECGTIKNSCGDYLDCPDGPTKGCSAGKECDPDTHKCRECQAVTCGDLGIECGLAWLGCGENIPANFTDCGGCADLNGQQRRCNAISNSCEPSCTPKPAAEICAEAKTKKGVECGVISNGCGGSVDCSQFSEFQCPAGQLCGVRGISNRCDPKTTPDECVAQGRECGEITSLCTGQKVRCGDCPMGQVCNANGRCGAPCQPKTCADFAEFPCGNFDDTCGGTLNCPCAGGSLCNTTARTCCAANTCGTTYTGRCGQDLANGCGQNNLDCNCAGGTICTTNGGATPAPPTSTPGSCCSPRSAAFYAGQCGTNLPNGCGQNNINVNCPGSQVCVANGSGQPGPAPASGTPGTCCTRTNECAAAAPGCASQPNSCRPTSNVSCTGNCTGGDICNANTCCTGAPACAGGGGENAVCNTVTTPGDPGCGANRTCNCAGGRTCVCTNGGTHTCSGGDPAGTCKTAQSCGSYGANKCGNDLSNGVGGTIDCGCPNGRTCSQTAVGVVGDCLCNNPTGNPYTCANVPNGPSTGGDACGTFNNGCGGSITCNCPVSGQVCNTTANPNVCCQPMSTCPTPGQGSQCGSIPNGCGGSISCGCPTGAANANYQCVAGTCNCVKDTCRGRTGPQPDLCGGTLQCGG